MNLFRLAAICATLSLPSATALADWDPGDPYKMHYPQLPDLTTNGLDVLAGPRLIPITPDPIYYEKFLADDFLCTFSGPITDIHFWGSYNEDLFLGGVKPSDAYFSLVIYDDVPADATNPYSHPGNALWSTYTKPTQARLYAPNTQEGFYDPNVPVGQNPIIGTDTQVWQYNFLFDPADAFQQKQGNIYWLGVHASADLNGDGAVDLGDLPLYTANFPGLFGWKTSGSPHFNDDAVFTDVNTIGGDPHTVPVGPWRELRHPVTGESLDLAFVITGIPEPSSVMLLALGVIGALAFIRHR